jgi:hypothetical protein
MIWLGSMMDTNTIARVKLLLAQQEKLYLRQLLIEKVVMELSKLTQNHTLQLDMHNLRKQQQHVDESNAMAINGYSSNSKELRQQHQQMMMMSVLPSTTLTTNPTILRQQQRLLSTVF